MPRMGGGPQACPACRSPQGVPATGQQPSSVVQVIKQPKPHGGSGMGDENHLEVRSAIRRFSTGQHTCAPVEHAPATVC